MAVPIDIDALKTAIIGKLRDIAQSDIDAHIDFVEKQTKGLATQSAWIARARLEGELDEDDLDFFLEDLRKLSESFVKVVIGLTIITIEKAWNAVVNTLWEAIGGAIDSVLTIPGVPKLT